MPDESDPGQRKIANLVLVLGVLAAAIGLVVGGLLVRDGSPAGWLLIVSGMLPLVFALMVRALWKDSNR